MTLLLHVQLPHLAPHHAWIPVTAVLGSRTLVVLSRCEIPNSKENVTSYDDADGYKFCCNHTVRGLDWTGLDWTVLNRTHAISDCLEWHVWYVGVNSRPLWNTYRRQLPFS